jgi:hypothetical protein
MPFISDTQIARLQGSYASMQNKMAKAKAKAAEKAGEFKQLAEVVGSAGAMGFIRGKMEDKSTGAFNIPGTSIDVELIVALALVGTSMLDLFGEFDEDVLNAGSGILAHYTGQIARHWGKTGQFSFIAGAQFPGQGNYGAYAGLPHAGVNVGQEALARALSQSAV